MAPRGRHRSSAPLQVLLFLNGWYCATYFLLEAFVFVYKGSKGNLCQQKVPLSLSLALTVPAAVLAVYYLLLQTYSLRLEAFLSAILLLFYGLELLLGFLALLSFSRCRILGTGGPGAGAARKATGALYKRLTTSSEFITQFQPIQRQI
ncbi:transmembrane protein 216 isoform X2 [Chamaea fasciata]|uniref:transmembrane protein 216 isoform X2 n=1 Tax=Chamaea fasciata TaxID=190680 RepID=UPI00336A5DE1